MPRATFNANGRVIGLYDDSAFPEEAVIVSEEDRAHLAEYPDAWRWNGSAVIAYTPPPAPNTQVNFLGFLALFTMTEQAAIVGSTDPRIKLFCLMAAGAQYVDLTDPRVVAGTKLLESQNLIGSGRAAEVLAGQAPPVS